MSFFKAFKIIAMAGVAISAAAKAIKAYNAHERFTPTEEDLQISKVVINKDTADWLNDLSVNITLFQRLFARYGADFIEQQSWGEVAGQTVAAIATGGSVVFTSYAPGLDHKGMIKNVIELFSAEGELKMTGVAHYVSEASNFSN